MSAKLMPPDGGWGWMIALALTLNNIVMIPILQGFGLIFKDRFISLGMSATDAAVIINVNSAFGMLLGLVNGPLLRSFGYRKIALIGSAIFGLGVMFTAFANTFSHFIITYGIMTSVGLNLSMSSFSLALNTYFMEKRSRAMGLAMTATGVGPIVMPQIISFLLVFYGVQGTVLVLGAYCLHSIIGALLLQPVKWHLKKVEESPRDVGKSLDDVVGDGLGKRDNRRDSLAGSEIWKRKRSGTISSIDYDVETGSIYGFEMPIQRKISETVAPPAYRSQQLDNLGSSERPRPDYKWWSSANESLDAVNLGSCMTIFDETVYMPFVREESHDEAEEERDDRNENLMKALIDKKHVEQLKEGEEEEEMEEKKDNEETKIVRTLQRVILFFDLDLLRDPTYVNIMLGMSLAIFSELNFSLLTPFILGDMGFRTNQIAAIMSTIASLDLIFRGISPFVGEWLRKTPRSMYLFSLILLVSSRTTLMFAESFHSALLVSVGLGIAKGFRSVYMTLVIPSYVPIEKLASASGIQLVVNGIFMMCGGPLLGLIRDKSGSYVQCIILINVITCLTIIMWIGEILIKGRIKKHRKREERVNIKKLSDI